MLARVTMSEGKIEQIDAGIQYFKDHVGPAAKKVAGFKGSYLMVDRKTGKMLGIALWDNQESLKASEEIAAQLRPAVTHAAAATKPPIVEIYEVAVHLE